jgi:hypothetical protein
VSTASLLRLIALSLVSGAAATVLSATPAAAHGAGGLVPTDYETRVLGTKPALHGVEVRVVDLGTRLELTNDTAQDVVVLGYDGEPYLRVGPRGVFVNSRSPARYLNRTFRATTPVPPPADPTAPPRWIRTGNGRTVRWHDHRAHWMGSSDPPSVQRDRGAVHLVQRWSVELRHAGSTITVFGDVRWVPGPSPWLWLLVSVVLAGCVLAGARTRRWPAVLGAAVVVVLAAQVIHVAGGWGSSTASSWAHVTANTYELLGALAGVAALVTLLRRGAWDAVPVFLIAGLVMLIGGGLAEISVLWHSQLPFTLPARLDRLVVAIALGGGAGIAVGAAMHLRTPAAATARPKPRRRLRAAQPVG